MLILNDRNQIFFFEILLLTKMTFIIKCVQQ